MEFKQLQSFIEVVRLESFTKAAETLYISQPTISAHIHQLEEELQTRLLVRDTKNIEVTPKGRELYEYAVNILDMKDRMLNNCSSAHKKYLSFGVSSIPSAYILPAYLARFSIVHPDMTFRLHQGDSQEIIDGVMGGLYDLGIVGSLPDGDKLEAIPFSGDRLVLITPTSEPYRSYKEANVHFTEILKGPMILREPGSGTAKRAEEFLREFKIAPESLWTAARTNDAEAIKNLVAGGMGSAIISEKAAENFLKEGKILAFDLPGRYSSRKFYIIYRKTYIPGDELGDFIKLLRS